MPTPTVELEPAPAPLPVGPIALWQTAMVTKYEWMLIEFSRDGTSWTIIQRSKYYSVSRMLLREKLVSVNFMNFMVIVTDPRNESTREIIKVSCEVIEIMLLTHVTRAPLELVPRPGWSKHLA